MPVPDYQSLTRPLLSICNDGNTRIFKELHDIFYIEYENMIEKSLVLVEILVTSQHIQFCKTDF